MLFHPPRDLPRLDRDVQRAGADHPYLAPLSWQR
jgi:hypothetical protein